MGSATIALWSAAVGLWKDNAVAKPAAVLGRAEVLTRYRHLREISKQHHSAALDFLSKDAVISQARRLGLAQGKTLVLDSMDDLNLAFDLAIHTAPKDRSRAIDRYARAARLAPESDEALVLEAMRRARFSIISFERRHAVAWSVRYGARGRRAEGRNVHRDRRRLPHPSRSEWRLPPGGWLGAVQRRRTRRHDVRVALRRHG